jgi:hypothetical protein
MNSTERKSAMKKLRILSLMFAAIALTAFASAQTAAQKAFTSIKALPGTWEGNTSQGPVKVTFKTVSDGSAVMSEILGHADMISMIHLDGPNKLLLTHYCSTGNQPRMQASISPDGKAITFNLFDVSNLSAPDAGHMQKMVLTIVDDNHHTEEWIYADHGKEHRELFDLHRIS